MLKPTLPHPPPGLAGPRTRNPGSHSGPALPILMMGEGALGRGPVAHFLPPGPESLPLPSVWSLESPLAQASLLENPFPRRMEVEVEWTGPGPLGVNPSRAGSSPAYAVGLMPRPAPRPHRFSSPSHYTHCRCINPTSRPFVWNAFPQPNPSVGTQLRHTLPMKCYLTTPPLSRLTTCLWGEGEPRPTLHSLCPPLP